MTYPLTAQGSASDQLNPTELAASVKQMTEYLSRDCADAGLGLLAHLLATVSLEAQDLLNRTDPNWNQAAEETSPVRQLG